MVISLSINPTARQVQQCACARNLGYWVVAKYGSPRETGQSKQCEFCICLLDNSFDPSKWSEWSGWSVLLGVTDGQGVWGRVIKEENCTIVGLIGSFYDLYEIYAYIYPCRLIYVAANLDN